MGADQKCPVLGQSFKELPQLAKGRADLRYISWSLCHRYSVTALRTSSGHSIPPQAAGRSQYDGRRHDPDSPGTRSKGARRYELQKQPAHTFIEEQPEKWLIRHQVTRRARHHHGQYDEWRE